MCKNWNKIANFFGEKKKTKKNQLISVILMHWRVGGNTLWESPNMFSNHYSPLWKSATKTDLYLQTSGFAGTDSSSIKLINQTDQKNMDTSNLFYYCKFQSQQKCAQLRIIHEHRPFELRPISKNIKNSFSCTDRFRKLYVNYSSYWHTFWVWYFQM